MAIPVTSHEVVLRLLAILNTVAPVSEAHVDLLLEVQHMVRKGREPTRAQWDRVFGAYDTASQRLHDAVRDLEREWDPAFDDVLRPADIPPVPTLPDEILGMDDSESGADLGDGGNVAVPGHSPSFVESNGVEVVESVRELDPTGE